eukprot:TRINITY_DN2767_c0_g1_i2.p1 TRINITY_DN2767_c0_g1~~TRINITY_DN2767_c0_g1_i2.p1  ORF type:complete len:453 (+),score=105.13 TRINITY_DN2767_c0_g1_i2:110-1468(+)
MWRIFKRATIGLTVVGTAAIAVDTVAYDQRAVRVGRSLLAATATAWDFYNIDPKNMNSEHNSRIHRRVAERIVNTCRTNGGLYIKLGQGFTTASHILPPEYDILRTLHDKAPVVDFYKVEKLFREDFGRSPQEMFKEFNPVPVASASIAQVHEAYLEDGRKVAVKVQKPHIRGQIEADLLCNRLILYFFDWFFDIPVIWSADHTEAQLRKETDFINEKANGEKAARDFKQSGLPVYIPSNVDSHCSSRVLTSEWIDGVKIDDAEGIRQIGLTPKTVMDLVIEANSYQLFVTGFVHADPHAGNVFVRVKNGKPEIVMLDHGLYADCSPKFRREFTELFRAAILSDHETVERVVHEWGFTESNLLTSLILMRNYSNEEKAGHLRSTKANDIDAFQNRAKQNLRNFLKDTKKTPRDLIFVSRSMNITRANNKYLGSLSNRINIMAHYANQGDLSS